MHEDKVNHMWPYTVPTVKYDSSRAKIIRCLFSQNSDVVSDPFVEPFSDCEMFPRCYVLQIDRKGLPGLNVGDIRSDPFVLQGV